MLRRGVLRLGAGGVSAALASCVKEAGPPPALPSLAQADLDALAKMDLVVQGILASRPEPEAYGVAVLDGRAVSAAHALAAKSLATMHTVATFSELPAATQAHPDVQRRMWATLPGVHDATMSMTDWLDGLDAAARRRIDDEVRRDEGVTMRVVERLDEEAKRRGIPESHRLKLRAAAAHLAWRLKHQGTGAVVDDLVGKVDRVVARHGAHAELERAVAAKVAEAGLFGAPQATAPAPAGAPQPTPPAPPAPASGEGETGPLRVRIVSTAAPSAIQRTACGLRPRVSVGGRERPIDLRPERAADPAACGSADPDAVRGVVRLRREGAAWEVTLEMDPADAGAEQRAELRAALRDVGAELHRRLAVFETGAGAAPPPAATSAAAPPSEPEPAPAQKTRRSAKVLTASAILWGIGLTVGGVGGIMAGAGAADSNGAGLVIGGAIFLTVASLVVLAGIVTLIIAGVLYARDD